jgi:hypothetical protein
MDTMGCTYSLDEGNVFKSIFSNKCLRKWSLKEAEIKQYCKILISKEMGCVNVN